MGLFNNKRTKTAPEFKHLYERALENRQFHIRTNMELTDAEILHIVNVIMHTLRTEPWENTKLSVAQTRLNCFYQDGVGVQLTAPNDWSSVTISIY